MKILVVLRGTAMISMNWRFNLDCSRYTYVKSINPQVKFSFQLWLGRQTADQMISTFNKLQNYIDVAVIGSNAKASSNDIQRVVKGLNWR